MVGERRIFASGTAEVSTGLFACLRRIETYYTWATLSTVSPWRIRKSVTRLAMTPGDGRKSVAKACVAVEWCSKENRKAIGFSLSLVCAQRLLTKRALPPVSVSFVPALTGPIITLCYVENAC
jgi:hypothetical protein